MKKLLVLVLVLGLASVASAMITSPVEIIKDGSTFSINLPSGMNKTNDGQGGYWALVGELATPVTGGVLSAPAPMSLSAIYGDAGDTGFFAYGIGIWGEFTTSSTGAWTAPAGAYATGFGASGDLYLYLIDDGFGSATLVDTYSAVPEPATMLLLGLGGLFLRRRK